MSRWRDHPIQVERELRALDSATFGLSYGGELRERILTSLGSHVSLLSEIGGPPGAFSAVIAVGRESVSLSALPREIARILF
jgi:hypothetical protein